MSMIQIENIERALEDINKALIAIKDEGFSETEEELLRRMEKAVFELDHNNGILGRFIIYDALT